MIKKTINLLEKIRTESPLVHNITNYVVMNFTANVLLAIGASPVMAHAPEEVEEMVSMSGALVLNIGTLQNDWIDSMILAAKAANSKGIPVILDPVGSGATKLRTESAKRIVEEVDVSVIRGNASEIMSLTTSSAKTRGVDSSESVTDLTLKTASMLSAEKKCVVAVSGVKDFITDGSRTFCIENGHKLMTKVTGMGCGLTSAIGAFCAVSNGDLIEATTSAFGFYGLCAEIAASISEKPGSFQTAFLDTLYSAGEKEIAKYMKCSLV